MGSRFAVLARVAAAVLLLGAAISGVACADGDRNLASTGGPDAQRSFDLPDGDPNLDAGPALDLEAGPAYAVLGLQPSHGPFNGKTRVEIRGRGFSSKSKVRLGAIEVPTADVTPLDPYHVQIITPAGDVGPVDVTVRDELTRASSVLVGGFTYDSYYAEPSSGATTGGTHVSLIGRGTAWSTGTTATIDGKECTDLAVDDTTHLHCVAPPGTPGTKSISVTTPDKVVSTVRDAYTYADTSDGYRGGLAGAKLPGELKVLALVNPLGDLAPGATVVVRGVDGATQTGLTSAAGVASFPAPPPAPVTVTITRKCLQPTTFDGVNVRSVTAYLNPVLSVACVPPDGAPPPVGPRVREAGVVRGELVWPRPIEFRRALWNGVPAPTKPSQRAAAYVFALAGNNLFPFQLPDPSAATLETSRGTVGYEFQVVVSPGNVTLYAIAGIEDRTPGVAPTFDPYVYGVVRGVGVAVGGFVDRVLIPMNGQFTHEARIDADGVPVTSRGPDRFISSVAVDLGSGYMLLPNGRRNDLLPLGGPLRFAGIPPLSGALGSASYVFSVEGVTGGPGGAPTSSILRYRTRDVSKAFTIRPFVPLPRITSPSPGIEWDGRSVKLDLPPKVADVLLIGLNAGDGSSAWTIIAPGEARTINLPDFIARPELGLPHGNLLIGAYASRVEHFVYDEVRYGQLNRAQWSAFAFDTFIGRW